MIPCFIEAIVAHQPRGRLDTHDLVARVPGWDAEKVIKKTGIHSRPIVAPGETASDLAAIAAEKLFAGGVDRAEIDALILVTQSPDYVLPASACLLQARLGLRDTTAAFDVNLACSGLPYMLWLGRSLIASGSARKVLLLFADTYSRYCRDDVTIASLFSDGAAAVLLGADEKRAIAKVGPSLLGTDGASGEALIVRQGGARSAARGEPFTPLQLEMDGPAIFSFALARIKPQVEALLGQVGTTKDDVDRWYLHQANKFMLEALRTKLGVAAERCPIDVADVGNAATASLPMLLARQLAAGAIPPRCRSLVIGFGVGLSWGTSWVEWV
ncbi:MAG TPA: ketoacyl-ACP synthase III [Kofleriaceae bacterium]|jgi:3-oxoacyl-[acyl-carrier-protein] synthase-3